MAVALLARRPEPLNDLVKSLRSQNPSSVLEAFPTDTQPDNLKQAFASIKAHESFAGLKLKVAIFSVKNSSKKPFMEETFDEFMAPLESYVGGAMVFAQESLRRMFEDHGEKTLAEGAEKKGTIIFTGTLVCFSDLINESRPLHVILYANVVVDRVHFDATPSMEATALRVVCSFTIAG
jgi:short-subunit dehydrogenase